jgi:hypothetical protein
LKHESQSEEVQLFANTIYQQYWIDNSGNGIPTRKIGSFHNEVESKFGGVRDMYKDAMCNLMMGSYFTPLEEALFWDCLIPPELES